MEYESDMLLVIRQESFKALSIVSMESMESIEKGNEKVKPASDVHNRPYLLINRVVDCVHTIQQGVPKKQSVTNSISSLL